MWELVEPDEEALEDFCIYHLGLPKVPHECTFLAFRKDDQDHVSVGAMFERYTGEGGSVTAHWASEGGYVPRDVLTMAFLYVFDQLGCARMIGEVRASDAHVRRVDEKLGMKEVAVIPGYFPDDDLVIYELKREDCKFLTDEVRYGQTVETTGSGLRQAPRYDGSEHRFE